MPVGRACERCQEDTGFALDQARQERRGAENAEKTFFDAGQREERRQGREGCVPTRVLEQILPYAGSAGAIVDDGSARDEPAEREVAVGQGLVLSNG